ncbi:MAG TPA: flagellar biosynthetic protein FliO [Actinoplanes sp.]
MFELVLRIGFSLLVVLGLMWALARVARRPLGARGHGPLAVLNRQQLTRGSAVAVIRVADRAMIIGVTDQQVSLLGEADLDDFEPHQHERRNTVAVDADELPGAHPAVHRVGRLDRSLLSPRTWAAPLDFLRDRTTRR